MVTKTTTAKKAIANKPAAKKTPIKKMTPITKQLDSVVKAVNDLTQSNTIQDKIHDFAKKIISSLDTVYRSRRPSRAEITVSNKDLSAFLGTGKNLVKNFNQLYEVLISTSAKKDSKFSEYYVGFYKSTIVIEKFNMIAVKLNASEVIEEIKSKTPIKATSVKKEVVKKA